MIKTSIFKKNIALISAVALCFCLCYSCHSPHKNLPILNMEDMYRIGLEQIDEQYKNYSSADCIFLKNTSLISPASIQNIHCYKNDLYILLPESVLQYDLSTGNLVYRYKPLLPVNFVDFSFDSSSKTAYILDNKNAQVLKVDLTNDHREVIKLDSAYTYAMIKRIKGNTFLIPKQTVPLPSFVTVDFDRNEVKAYATEIAHNKEVERIPEGSDSKWKKYPLYVGDEVKNGVLLKYLFDERVYLCTIDSISANYHMKMGSQKVKTKYPWNATKLKNNKRYRIKKFWHGSQKTYVLHQEIVENILGVFDYKGLSQFKDKEPVNGFSGFVAKSFLSSLMPTKEEIFMDDECKRFLSFRNINDKEREIKYRWPKHMLNAENDRDIVVSIFVMK